MDGHLWFCGSVCVVVQTVDISIHQHVFQNLSIPLSQGGGVPGQLDGAGCQAGHTQVLGVAAGNVFRGADLLDVLLSIACLVLGR